MIEIKECIGQWTNCPESTSTGFCRKKQKLFNRNAMYERMVEIKQLTLYNI